VSQRFTADAVADALGLVPLPEEGGRWKQTLLDERSSAIYYLLTKGDFSALHCLNGDEVYHYYAGAPAQMLLLFPGGIVEEPVLGADLVASQHPQLVVPAGIWQGSATQGEWTLLGTTMAPPYTEEGFTLGKKEQLISGWPQANERIKQLTRK
jgi:predicted cupin superfamily sugar epimerase